VSLVGLNLSNPAQAAEFAARVDIAADSVCRARARTNPDGDFTIAGCKVAARKQAAAATVLDPAPRPADGRPRHPGLRRRPLSDRMTQTSKGPGRERPGALTRPSFTTKSDNHKY
jgi:hypothetical protein